MSMTIETVIAHVTGQDLSDLAFKVDKSTADHRRHGWTLAWQSNGYDAGYPYADLVFCRCPERTQAEREGNEAMTAPVDRPAGSDGTRRWRRDG